MANHRWEFDGKILPTIEKDLVPEIVWDSERFFSFELYGKNYHGEVIAVNVDSGKLTVKINHRVFEVLRKRPINEIIAQLKLDQVAEKKLTVLKSPMPGKVLDIQVSNGQAIKVGDSLLTLEAMKMENVIKAEGVGMVKSILVTVNDTVEKDAILIEFE